MAQLGQQSACRIATRASLSKQAVGVRWSTNAEQAASCKSAGYALATFIVLQQTSCPHCNARRCGVHAECSCYCCAGDSCTAMAMRCSLLDCLLNLLLWLARWRWFGDNCG